jgi:hypothetical protein
MSYDAKCLELAHHFLDDVPALSDDERKARANRLAERIQQTIEDELAFEEDTRTDRLCDVVQVIERLGGGPSGLTARAIIEKLFDDAADASTQSARTVIETVTHCRPGERPDPSRLGAYLARNRGRVALGRSIERVSVKDAANHWAVRPQPETTAAP